MNSTQIVATVAALLVGATTATLWPLWRTHRRRKAQMKRIKSYCA